MSGVFLGTSTWAGGTITFDDGTNPLETYDYDTELGYPVATLYQVATSVVAWINDAARAWTGVISATLSVATDNDPYMGIVVTFAGGTFDVEGFDGLQSDNTGWDDGSGLSSLDGAGSAWAVVCDVKVSGWLRQTGEPGAMSGSGSWVMGGAVAGANVPGVALTLNESQAGALHAGLRTAGSPRIAHVWDVVNDAWRLVALGALRTRKAGRLHQQVTAEVMG